MDSVSSSSDMELRSVSSEESYTQNLDWEGGEWHDEWYDDEPENVVDRIYMQDMDFVDRPKRHGNYYIANAFCCGKYYLLGICISPRIFFRHRFVDVVQYMYEYIIHYKWSAIPNKTVDIIQLYIEGDTYKAVLKTHWIRLIQRHWKKAFAERKRVIKLRRDIRNIVYCQQRGRYVNGANYLPSIHGLLEFYNTKNPQQ